MQTQTLTLTLSQAYQAYFKNNSMAESSADIKRRAFRYFQDLTGDMPIDKIGYAAAEDFKNWLGEHKTKESGNIYIRNLKPFFNWLIKRGYLQQNPFAAIGVFKISEKRPEVFKPEEIERILRVADLRWQVITLLGLCSLRRSEVLNLTIADLCFEKNYIKIQPKTNTPETWDWEIKNHQRAIVPVPKKFVFPDMIVDPQSFIKQLIAGLPFEQPYVCVMPAMYMYLINLKAVGRLTWQKKNCPWSNFNRSWRALLKHAAVRHRNFHCLRATFATTMSGAGLSLSDTAKLMRHSSTQTTARYYIAVDEEALVSKVAEISETNYAIQKNAELKNDIGGPLRIVGRVAGRSFPAV
jgi:integrase